MNKIVPGLRSAWSHIPASVKKQALHVALTFVVAFVAVAAPAVPKLLSDAQLGHFPSFSVLHALVAAGFAAGLKAAIPAVRAAVVALSTIAYGWVKVRQARRLEKAVAEYLAVKAAADAQAAAAAQVAQTTADAQAAVAAIAAARAASVPADVVVPPVA